MKPQSHIHTFAKSINNNEKKKGLFIFMMRLRLALSNPGKSLQRSATLYIHIQNQHLRRFTTPETFHYTWIRFTRHINCPTACQSIFAGLVVNWKKRKFPPWLKYFFSPGKDCIIFEGILSHNGAGKRTHALYD